MRATVVGFMPLDFVDKTGKPVVGTSVYINYAEDDQPNLVGVKADKLFLRKGAIMPADLDVGDVIDVFYNKNRKAEMIMRATI